MILPLLVQLLVEHVKVFDLVVRQISKVLLACVVYDALPLCARVDDARQLHQVNAQHSEAHVMVLHWILSVLRVKGKRDGHPQEQVERRQRVGDRVPVLDALGFFCGAHFTAILADDVDFAGMSLCLA